MRESARRWVGPVPVPPREDARPSPSTPKLGCYYCFGCGAKGDVITFVREIEHLDFVEAVEKLAARAGITLRYDDTRPPAVTTSSRTRIHETLERAVAWYHQRLLDSPGRGRSPRATSGVERGYDGEVVRRYRLGWAPEGWDDLVRALGAARGRCSATPVWLRSTESGRLQRFLPRPAALSHLRCRRHGRSGSVAGSCPVASGPKYKNTAETAVYDKSRVLYGLNWAKKAVVDAGRGRRVRGLHRRHRPARRPASARRWRPAARPWPTATSGCSPTSPAGSCSPTTPTAPARRRPSGSTSGSGASRSTSRWPPCRPAADPADLARQRSRRPAPGRRRGPALPGLPARTGSWPGPICVHPKGRARAAAEAMAVVAEHPNELVRDQYLMQVADRCRVDPDRLRAGELGRAGRAGRRSARDRSRRRRPARARPAARSARGAGRRPPVDRRRAGGPAAGRPPARDGGRPAGGGRCSPTSCTGSAFRGPVRGRPPCTRRSRRPIRRPPTCCRAWPSRTATRMPTTS